MEAEVSVAQMEVEVPVTEMEAEVNNSDHLQTVDQPK
jgi:hypothetical protein